MILNEENMLVRLADAKRVLLLEPPYSRQWVPLDLAKIASFVKEHGGEVDFSRNPVMKNYDLICVTTLFTTQSKIVLKTISDCQRGLYTKNVPIIAGGIFASLMPEYIMKKTGIDVYKGYSKKLDLCLPDYSVDWQLEGYFKDTMMLFTARGCPNRCAYCMVWRMEPDYYILDNWKELIEKNDKKICVLIDNNILAAPLEHLTNVVEALNRNKKKVILNGGVDCKLVTKENAKLLASLSYTHRGFRIAFDRMEDDGHFQRAMEMLIKAGLKPKGNSYGYVLFNFDDTPQEAFYRTMECMKYDVEPYVMRYKPLNRLANDVPFIGKYWTKNLVLTFSVYWQNYGWARNGGSFEKFVEGYKALGNDKRVYLTKEDWDKWNYVRK
jgi:hypothetical protein